MTPDDTFEQLRDALWYLLDCRCAQCGLELDLLEWDGLKDRNAMGWSRIAAERAMEAGWAPAREEIAVFCPTCVVKQS